MSDEKTQRNARVQARYAALMQGGRHGHYETMFKVVREEVEAERERCARIASLAGCSNPKCMECYGNQIAAAIRDGESVESQMVAENAE